MTKSAPPFADQLIELVRGIHGTGFIPLHRPIFEGKERQYLIDCIDSNFVSSVGEKVKEFESLCTIFVNVKHGVASVNGTAALHTALMVSGVKEGDEVITQALTFVATCNAISYCGARPVFIDVDRDTMGLSPYALEKWLSRNAVRRNGVTYNRKSGARLSACVPMHTFGFPMRVSEVADICDNYGLAMIEDAAESLGSFVGTRHTGTFGDLATLSFNGNKVITTGGGGMILSNSEELANRSLHLMTTAKVQHPYEFVHDEIGYNYRLPNLNAALGCAQIEYLPSMLKSKSEIADTYREFFSYHGIEFMDGIDGTTPNYWLNAIVLSSKEERDSFLQHLNNAQVMSRPIWRLMSKLAMFKDCERDMLENASWLEDRVVNIPSSVPDGVMTER